MIGGFVVVCVAGLAGANEPPPPPPPLSPATLTTPEDTVLTTTLTAPEGARLKLRKAGRRGTATLDETTAQLRYAPNKDVFGDDDIVVEVTVDGRRSEQKLTITVTRVNDLPVVEALALATKEETATGARLTARDVDGDTLVFAIGEPPANGSATVDRKGNVVFTPNKDVVGDSRFTVVVGDGHGGEAVAVVTVKIANVNDPPIASNARLDTNEDVAGRVVVAASDVDGDTLTYAVATAPKRGTAVIDSRGEVTFTPAKDFNGKDTLVVAVRDPAGAVVNATVELVVAPVNDPPRGALVRASTREDTAVTANVGAVDVDGDTLRYEIPDAASPAVARVDGKGVLTFTPPADHNTKAGAEGDRIVVRVDDGHGGVADVPVVVVVAPVNDRPTIASRTFAVEEDRALTAKIDAADIDGDPLRFVLFTPPKSGRATLSKNGELRYSAPRDWHGKDTLTVEIDDGQAFARQEITVTVAPMNDPPVARQLSLTTDEDRAVKGMIAATDVDGDTLRYELRTPAGHGDVVVDAASGRLVYTPLKDWHGKDAFTVAVHDKASEAIAAVDVVVAAIPDAPVVFADTLKVDEDTAGEGPLPAREPDGERLTFALVGEAKLGTVTLLDKRTGRIRYVPRANLNGKDRIAFTATDNITVVSGVLDIDVVAVNDAPVATGATAMTREDTPVEVTIAMTDIDDDQPQVEVVGAVEGGLVEVVDAKKGRLRVVPGPDFHGTVRFKARAKEALASAPVDVVVTVDAVNDAPTIVGGRFTTIEDTVLTETLKRGDVDGDRLEFRVARTPTRGTVVVDKSSGTFVYTPKEDATGKDSFVVVVKDTAGLEASAAVDVEVTAVDDAPIALEGRLRSPRAGRVTGTLVGRDPEGAPLRFVLAQQPGLGRVEIVDERAGTYRYIAEGQKRSGRTTFTFFVEAGGQRSVPASVLIDID